MVLLRCMLGAEMDVKGRVVTAGRQFVSDRGARAVAMQVSSASSNERFVKLFTFMNTPKPW